METFYASIEQRDDPSPRGRAFAVGISGARGIVAAASFEAPTLGVRAAMASVTERLRRPSCLRATSIRRLPRGVGPDPRDLRRLHRPNGLKGKNKQSFGSFSIGDKPGHRKCAHVARREDSIIARGVALKRHRLIATPASESPARHRLFSSRARFRLDAGGVVRPRAAARRGHPQARCIRSYR